MKLTGPEVVPPLEATRSPVGRELIEGEARAAAGLLDLGRLLEGFKDAVDTVGHR